MSSTGVPKVVLLCGRMGARRLLAAYAARRTAHGDATLVVIYAAVVPGASPLAVAA